MAPTSMVFLFMPVWNIITARDLANTAETNVELCKHRAHTPRLLAEKLRLGQSAINEWSWFKYRYLLHDHSNSKV